MTLIEQVNEQVRELPEEAVAEVLDFIGYLWMKLGKFPYVGSSVQRVSFEDGSMPWDAKAFVKKFAGSIPDFPDIEEEGPIQERDWVE
ncbi:MAG: DUF2281 domain-containing protein [Magnetococcales bacterium]|nr:DUF2281 domain-containing protein [Magnetococcales bacterium]